MMTDGDEEKFKQLGFNKDQLRVAKTLLLGHGCDTCKYEGKSICAEPCMSCDIRLGNNKWEAKDDNTKS